MNQIYETKICEMCLKPFKRNTNKRNGKRLTKGLRSSRAVTCSPKCSRERSK